MRIREEENHTCFIFFLPEELKMIETKLWVALCALLVFNIASTGHADESHDVNPALPSSELHHVNDSSLNTTDSAHNSSDPKSISADTISLSSNTTKENGNISMSSNPGNNNGTTERGQLTSRSQNDSSTPSFTVTSSTNMTYATAPPASNHSNITDLHSGGHSNLSTQTAVFSLTSVSTPGPQTTKTSSTTDSIHTNSTSNTSLFTESTSSPVPANTSHTSKAQPKSTETPVERSTIMKSHSASPSQLNMEGDTATAHDSPTVNPLLAGLVSALIVVAVIIALLLFLKLRRRDSRPEFRRLQELPMDDMEDTPLSMYSY